MGKRYYYRPLSGEELEQKYLSKSGKVYRFIDGCRHTNEEKVGYCWNKEHRGFLTKGLMKRHKCCEKKCKYLQMYDKNKT